MPFLTFSRHVPVRGSGSYRDLSISLSVAHSSLMFQAFMSLLTVSFHCKFGCPLWRFLFILISTSALIFHSNLLLMTIVIGSILACPMSHSFPGLVSPPLPIAPSSSLLSTFSLHLACCAVRNAMCQELPCYQHSCLLISSCKSSYLLLMFID